MDFTNKLIAGFACVLLSSFHAFALEYNDGKFTWNYFPVEGAADEVRLGDGTNACIETSAAGAVTLPDVIDGKHVTGVAANAFKGCTKVTGISILGNLEWIEEGAFDGATSLKTFGTLNRNENFFSYEGALYMGDWEGAELVRVPPALEAEEFTGLVKPQVWYVYPGAFNGCANIQKIRVNYDSAEALAECSFADCSSFVEFVWAGEYWYDDEFCVKDGVLYCGDYERDGWCELIKWPTAKDMADFENLQAPGSSAQVHVRDMAFAGNPLQKVVIPAWASFDSSWAFADCDNLREIVLLGSADDASGNVLLELEDSGVGIEKVVYPGFPKGLAEDWEAFFDSLKEEYGGCYTNIVYERAADPNAGKTTLTIPYTMRDGLMDIYDFSVYAKDLTTITFEGPCPNEFVEILAVCSNVTKIVYSANPLYRDYDYYWTSWKEVKSWNWTCEFPGRAIVFEEGAIPAETQVYFEDLDCPDVLSGIWLYDEALDCKVCLSPFWPSPVGELKIPDGVYELGEGTLFGLDQVTKLVLPDSLTRDGYIDEYVGFETMTQLAEFEGGYYLSCCGDESMYYAQNGCLYCDGQLFRVPPAYQAGGFVLYGYPYSQNALVGCWNITSLTAGDIDALECIRSELDLTGCDRLARFVCKCKTRDLREYGYSVVDGVICENCDDRGSELRLLLWPNGKRPIRFYPKIRSVDCYAFRYLAHPEEITELTMPTLCEEFDLYDLAETYGVSNITKIICPAYPDCLSPDLLEVMPGLSEIVYNPNPFYAPEWNLMREEFKGTGVKFTAREPDEPLYGYELDVWETDEDGVILDGECYLGYGGCPFVYPVPTGVYEIPAKIENCRVVWAYENALGGMCEVTELVFPQSFRGFDTNACAGCTSLARLVFRGCCPDGLRELLETTPSVREVCCYYELPWLGESGLTWREFIEEFQSRHPQSEIVFTALPIPQEPVWQVVRGDLRGEYDPETGFRIPCVWPDLVGEATVPSNVHYIFENAFACMSNLTALTIPASVWVIGAGSYREGYRDEFGAFVETGEVDIVYSPFVGCMSLETLVFEGCSAPDGLGELLEVTPSIREVRYNDFPWSGASGFTWREFIAEFQSLHPESGVTFVALPAPDEPIYNCELDVWAEDEYGNVLDGECYLGRDGYPFVYPAPEGAYELPEKIGGCRVVGAYENAFANMSNLTEVTFPASFRGFDGDAFAGCTSLKRIVFKGDFAPDGLKDSLAMLPPGFEVHYNDIPWPGEYGCVWREFIAEFRSSHPESDVTFVALPAPVEPIWNIEGGEIYGEYDAETGWRVPCVWPDLVGEAMVPSNVYYIGANAFACMSNLTVLTIPASVEYFDVGTYREGYWDEDICEWVVTGEVDIVYSPFVGCTSLKKLVFDGGIPPDGTWELLELTPSIEEVVVPSWKFRGDYCEEGIFNEWLDWFVYDYKAEHPDSTIVFKKDDGTEIGDWEEYVPWKVEGDTMTVDWWADIDGDAFDGIDLSAVTKLVLPSALEYLEDGVFGALVNLREVEVIFDTYSDEVTCFGSKFGEGQRLKLTIKPYAWWECDCEYCDEDDDVRCPICHKEVDGEDCDETCGCHGYWDLDDFAIQPEQFENAEWIETLVIEEPAFAIADYAFGWCPNLKEAEIPASVEWMGEGVFAGCEKLENVYFNGNAPYGCFCLYDGASPNLVSYVKYGTTGWTGVDGEAGLPFPALWPVWEEDDATARPVEYGKITETGYAIVYLPNGGAGEMDYQVCARDKVYNLTKCAFKKTGKAFKGWAGSNGKRYDDGVLIFNAAAEGATLTLTAIWEYAKKEQ